MSLSVYIVRWKKDTNKHYPHIYEALDIAEARIVACSAFGAMEYVFDNYSDIVEIESIIKDDIAYRKFIERL